MKNYGLFTDKEKEQMEIPSVDPIGMVTPTEEEATEELEPGSLSSIYKKLMESDKEKALKAQIEKEQSPEARESREGKGMWGELARALGAGVAEYGQKGGGERFAKSTEGVIDKASGQKLRDLQKKLEGAKGDRQEGFENEYKLALLRDKLNPEKDISKDTYTYTSGIDPNTNKRVVWAVNNRNPKDRQPLFENPFAVGTFTNPETGEVVALDKTTKEITQITGRPNVTSEEVAEDPAKAWQKMPPKVKTRLIPLLKTYRDVSKDAMESANEVKLVTEVMKEYKEQPPGRRNAQLLNLVKGKIPRLAGEKGPLAVFDIQMYAGNQSLYNRANLFFKTLIDGNATEKVIEDNMDLLETLTANADKRITEKMAPFKTDIERESKTYGVTADDLLGLNPSKGMSSQVETKNAPKLRRRPVVVNGQSMWEYEDGTFKPRAAQ